MSEPPTRAREIQGLRENAEDVKRRVESGEHRILVVDPDVALGILDTYAALQREIETLRGQLELVDDFLRENGCEGQPRYEALGEMKQKLRTLYRGGVQFICDECGGAVGINDATGDVGCGVCGSRRFHCSRNERLERADYEALADRLRNCVLSVYPGTMATVTMPEVIAALRQAAQDRAIAEAVPSSEQLDWIAEWFDLTDSFLIDLLAGAARDKGMDVEPLEALRGNAVQRDLRKLAEVKANLEARIKETEGE